MSFNYAHVAVRGKRDDFREAFLDIWDNFRLVESSGELAGCEDLMTWSAPRCEYLRGKAPNDVKAFGQDGGWAVLTDFSMLLAGDGDRLRRLSARFGEAVVGLTQGTSGAALFGLYEGGALRR